MPFQSTKTYGHEVGLSACFRQWRATHSHCSKLHGYALAVKLVFEAEELDARNWVVDFGGLSAIKMWLQNTFDHKTVVAEDDPRLETFRILQKTGLCDVVVMKDVGCEAFAKHIFEYVDQWLFDSEKTYVSGEDPVTQPRVRLVSVEVREHGANSAVYLAPDPRFAKEIRVENVADLNEKTIQDLISGTHNILPRGFEDDRKDHL